MRFGMTVDTLTLKEINACCAGGASQIIIECGKGQRLT